MSKYGCHLCFKRLVDKNCDKVKFVIIHKTNQEYISVIYGCIIIIDSYRYLSSSLDKLVKAVVHNSQKTLKDLKEEIADNDEKLNNVNETGENKTIKDIEKVFPGDIITFEEALLNYEGGNDPKILRTVSPDNKWKCLTEKISYHIQRKEYTRWYKLSNGRSLCKIR